MRAIIMIGSKGTEFTRELMMTIVGMIFKTAQCGRSRMEFDSGLQLQVRWARHILFVESQAGNTLQLQMRRCACNSHQCVLLWKGKASFDQCVGILQWARCVAWFGGATCETRTVAEVFIAGITYPPKLEAAKRVVKAVKPYWQIQENSTCGSSLLFKCEDPTPHVGGVPTCYDAYWG